MIQYKDLVDQIELVEKRAFISKWIDDYMREKGWKYTCQNPGSRWLYKKFIDGSWFACDKQMAVSIQQDLDEAEPLSTGNIHMMCSDTECGYEWQDSKRTEKCPSCEGKTITAEEFAKSETDQEG